MSLERLAKVIAHARPENGFIKASFIVRGWAAQPDYRSAR